MPFLSITRLRVRSVRFLPPFLWYATASARQARRSAGCHGVRLRRTSRGAFWTLSRWDDESAMKAFRGRSPHRDAMARLARWCDEASYAHWLEPSDEWPTWEQGAQRLATTGRLSKVDHPSAEQAQGRIVIT